MDQSWHSLSIQDIFTHLQTSHDGLTSGEAKLRLAKWGPNHLQTHKGPSLFIIFARQFLNPLVFILIIASCIKFFVGNFLDGSVLSGTILIMIFIGFFQEVKAEHAMRALKNLAAHQSKVIRDGKIEIIPSVMIVPGDEIILEPGDKVPSDARLIETTNLKVNESILTGESMAVEKHIDAIAEVHGITDKRNMVFMGTTISSGKAIALVVSTGMSTELGKIATSLQEIKSEKTPLQKSIESISIWMIPVVFGAILFFALISFYRGMNWTDIFLLGVAAAVSAIPEGLPAAFTITLAAGMNTMAKRHAIIRNLVAVETLGSTTVICSDKTGTLTVNQMTVTQLYCYGKPIEVTGSGTETKGTFILQGQLIEPKKDPTLRLMLEIGALCNDALMTKNGKCEIIGDSTEGALLVAAAKAGYELDPLEENFPRIDEIPFQSENLYMATLHTFPAQNKIYVKGAPEKILSFSQFVLKDNEILPLEKKERDEILTIMEQMTKNALRLIAVAFCDFHSHKGYLTQEAFEGKLVFVGFFGMIDPPREEAIEAISACKKAGIKVVMVTGDNKMTALSIAKQMNISANEAIDGKEIQNLNNEELKEKAKNFPIFARVEPLHKLRIVQAFKELGHVVAMTGDGVNDAPALETAHIGIAMGISGTDVAKEASDMILSDDNFASVVSAVEEGRAIFNRLRNVCAFLLVTCLGELLGLILSVLLIGPPPLIPLQILWVNLVGGIVISIPLGYEPKTGNELKQPPRSPRVKILYKGMLYRIGFLAFMLGVSIYVSFRIATLYKSIETARTIAFCTVVIFEWLIAFSVRSDEVSIFRQGFFKNTSLIIVIAIGLVLQLLIVYSPFFQPLFKTTSLSWIEWLIALTPGVLIFFIETLRKELFPTLFSAGKWTKN